MVQVGVDAASALFLTLPFSRLHEEEADVMGLEILVQACFSPAGAPRVWEHLSVDEEKGVWPAQAKLAEVVSTHPSSAARAQALKEQLPRATAMHAAKCKVRDARGPY